MTSKLGGCNLFEYKFQVSEERPTVEYSPGPFSVCPAVSDQITQMIHDILEISSSPFINPLNLLYKEGKKITFCVYARRVNQYSILDIERIPPFLIITTKTLLLSFLLKYIGH
jgi:hypothetical protein